MTEPAPQFVSTGSGMRRKVSSTTPACGVTVLSDADGVRAKPEWSHMGGMYSVSPGSSVTEYRSIPLPCKSRHMCRDNSCRWRGCSDEKTGSRAMASGGASTNVLVPLSCV